MLRFNKTSEQSADARLTYDFHFRKHDFNVILDLSQS